MTASTTPSRSDSASPSTQRGARCPACAGTLEEQAFGDIVAHVCPDCKGLWVDWFDGALLQVAKEIAHLSSPPAPTSVRTAGNCPSCRAPLVVESTHGAGNAGMYLWRCGACVGTFVPRASFETLVGMDDAEPTTAPYASEPAEPRPLSRLAAALRALLGS